MAAKSKKAPVKKGATIYANANFDGKGVLLQVYAISEARRIEGVLGFDMEMLDSFKGKEGREIRMGQRGICCWNDFLKQWEIEIR